MSVQHQDLNTEPLSELEYSDPFQAGEEWEKPEEADAMHSTDEAKLRDLKEEEKEQDEIEDDIDDTERAQGMEREVDGIDANMPLEGEEEELEQEQELELSPSQIVMGKDQKKELDEFIAQNLAELGAIGTILKSFGVNYRGESKEARKTPDLAISKEKEGPSLPGKESVMSLS